MIIGFSICTFSSSVQFCWPCLSLKQQDRPALWGIKNKATVLEALWLEVTSLKVKQPQSSLWGTAATWRTNSLIVCRWVSHKEALCCSSRLNVISITLTGRTVASSNHWHMCHSHKWHIKPSEKVETTQYCSTNVGLKKKRMVSKKKKSVSFGLWNQRHSQFVSVGRWSSSTAANPTEWRLPCCLLPTFTSKLLILTENPQKEIDQQSLHKSQAKATEPSVQALDVLTCGWQECFLT